MRVRPNAIIREVWRQVRVGGRGDSQRISVGRNILARIDPVTDVAVTLEGRSVEGEIAIRTEHVGVIVASDELSIEPVSGAPYVAHVISAQTQSSVNGIPLVDVLRGNKQRAPRL